MKTIFCLVLLTITSLCSAFELQDYSDRTMLLVEKARTYRLHGQKFEIDHHHHIGMVCFERVEGECKRMQFFEIQQHKDEKELSHAEWIGNEVTAEDISITKKRLKNMNKDYRTLTYGKDFFSFYTTEGLGDGLGLDGLPVSIFLFPATFTIDLITFPVQAIFKGIKHARYVSKIKRVSRRISKFVNKGKSYNRGIRVNTSLLIRNEL